MRDRLQRSTKDRSYAERLSGGEEKDKILFPRGESFLVELDG